MRIASATALSLPWMRVQANAPVVVGFNAALGVPSWTAPKAIEAGLHIAVDEINARGGVLDGRPLRLDALDHRTTTARSRENVQAFAARSEVVALFCDSFSPAALDVVPLVHELKLPLLNPWAAADAIVDHGLRPGFTFRLSLRDSWAMPAVVRRAAAQRFGRIGLIALANSWGRGNEAALRGALSATSGSAVLVGVEWHNLADEAAEMGRRVEALRASGASAIVLVSSVADGCALIRALVALPKARRLPVLSHWGIAAGDFFGLCGRELGEVDLELVQTFSPERARQPRAVAVLRDAARRMGVDDVRRLPSVAGVAQAYDLMHLLARAINLAGRPDRGAVRDALERLPAHEGLMRRFERPFSPERHEALDADDVFMARFEADGQLRRAA